MAKITIQCNGAKSKVLLDGVDITDKVLNVHFSLGARLFPSVELEVCADDVKIDGEVNTKIIKEDKK